MYCICGWFSYFNKKCILCYTTQNDYFWSEGKNHPNIKKFRSEEAANMFKNHRIINVPDKVWVEGIK